MTAPIVGDTVDVHWGDDRHDSGIVEQLFAGTVTVRIPGPPEVTIVVAAVELAESGPTRWSLDL